MDHFVRYQRVTRVMSGKPVRGEVISMDPETKNVKVCCLPQDVGWSESGQYQWWPVDEVRPGWD